MHGHVDLFKNGVIHTMAKPLRCARAHRNKLPAKAFVVGGNFLHIGQTEVLNASTPTGEVAKAVPRF
ncbi:hypothetical protein B9Z39_10645 [Limnohabitans sp. JirII-29]|nr:hypothetical protein B9Z41_01055 [Limnohabitans sp. JirII-31]PUE26197.1 hypothetical protein B9Z39_10645 [Limnohabitans sp. JirII-29]